MSMADVTSDEIYNAIADTIGSSSSTSSNSSSSIQPSDAMPYQDLSARHERNDRNDMNQDQHLHNQDLNNIHSAHNAHSAHAVALEAEQLDVSSEAAVPVMDDFSLADLQDADQFSTRYL